MKKKIPNTYIIIFSLIILSAKLTWFINGGEYKPFDNGMLQYIPTKKQTSNMANFHCHSIRIYNTIRYNNLHINSWRYIWDYNFK